MIGHSIGEFVAACIAGVFTLEDALMLVANRGRFMWDLPEGAMLSVRLPAKEVEPRLSAELAIAAINGPSLCVVSGPHRGDRGSAKTTRKRRSCLSPFTHLPRFPFPNDG